MCCTNLQVTFEFLIVNHDVLCLLALKLVLLQIVLQGPQFLKTHMYCLPSLYYSIMYVHLFNFKREKTLFMFCTSLHELEVTTMASSSFFRVRASADCAPLLPSGFILWYSIFSSSRRCWWVWVVCLRALRRFILDSTFWSSVVRAA